MYLDQDKSDLTTRRGRNVFYSSENWKHLRAYKLFENPFCEEHAKHGETVVATEVHHIIDIKDRPDLCIDWTNLMSLCSSCHSRKTMQNLNKKKKDETYKEPKPSIKRLYRF